MYAFLLDMCEYVFVHLYLTNIYQVFMFMIVCRWLNAVIKLHGGQLPLGGLSAEDLYHWQCRAGDRQGWSLVLQTYLEVVLY